MNGVSPTGQANYMGSVSRLNDVFPDNKQPSYARGVLQGEGICATYNSQSKDNYLYSLNAQCCVVLTLYRPTTQQGAVIHFDHNITELINNSVDSVMRWMSNPSGDQIEATLCGGVWLMSGESIGDPIKSALDQHGIGASWDQWSFSNCCNVHNYGVVLDLQTGNIQSFEHSIDMVEDLMRPLWRSTSDLRKLHGVQYGSSDQRRFSQFMDRIVQPALAQTHGKIVYTQGMDHLRYPSPTEDQIKQHAIKLYSI